MTYAVLNVSAESAGWNLLGYIKFVTGRKNGQNEENQPQAHGNEEQMVPLAADGKDLEFLLPSTLVVQ